MQMRCLLWPAIICGVTGGACGAAPEEELADAIREALLFHVPFDESLEPRVGQGKDQLKTRFDAATKPKSGPPKYEWVDGYNKQVFRIAPGRGVVGGALECTDVLPRRGRLSFPARGNLAYRPGGWQGSVSVWINTDPDRLLKTKYCDPVQITQHSAQNGGIWCDFTPEQPRPLRMGIFSGHPVGQQRPKTSPLAEPVARVERPEFRQGQWHHLVIAFRDFDSRAATGRATLYVDGRAVGSLVGWDFHMDWDLDAARIYFALSFIGLMDELATFDRELTAAEVRLLYLYPGLLARSRAGSEAAVPSKLEALSKQLHGLIERGADRKHLERVQSQLLDLASAASSSCQEAMAIVKCLASIPPAGAAPQAPVFPFDAAAASAYQRAYAKWAGLPLSLPVPLADETQIQLLLVPPGEFQMGSAQDEPGRSTDYDESRHAVKLTKPFYLGRHEVTNGARRRFTEQTGYVSDGRRRGGGNAHDEKAVWKHRPGTHWRIPGFAARYDLGDDRPLVHVSHADCREFCRWLSDDGGLQFALPTEAQWEWACRAGAGTRYWWGNELDSSGKRLNAGDQALKRVHPLWPRETMPMDDGHAFPAPVGSYQANGFGLHDMLGNVWEFCSTRYGPFPQGKAISVDPAIGRAGVGSPFGGAGGATSRATCGARHAMRTLRTFVTAIWVSEWRCRLPSDMGQPEIEGRSLSLRSGESVPSASPNAKLTALQAFAFFGCSFVDGL